MYTLLNLQRKYLRFNGLLLHKIYKCTILVIKALREAFINVTEPFNVLMLFALF